MKINKNLDILKFFLAIGVLFLHMSSALSIIFNYPVNIFINVFIFNNCVPLFYIISGYLLYQKIKNNKDNKKQYLSKVMVSNSILLFKGFIILFALKLIAIYMTGNQFDFQELKILVLNNLLNNHLWFIYSFIFAIFIYKYCQNDRHVKQVFIIALSIFSIMYFYEFYVGRIFYIRYNNLYTNILSNLVVATIFVFLGICIASYNIEKLQNYKISLYIALIISIIYTFIMSFIELQTFGTFYHSGLSQIPTVISFFLLYLTFKQVNISDKISRRFRENSIYLYICHPPVLSALSILKKHYNFSDVYYIFFSIVGIILLIILLHFLESLKYKYILKNKMS